MKEKFLSIKYWLEDHKKTIVAAVFVALAMFVSFSFGYLIALDNAPPAPIIIEKYSP